MHKLSTRFTLFSQRIDSATLAALVAPEASPNFAMGGGHFYFSDDFATSRGMVVSGVASFRKIHARVLPQGSGPMFFIEQGEIEGNYFDTLRRSASRFDWREALRFPGFNAWGRHQLGFGGGLARSAFESTQIGNTIILRGREEDELTAIFTFTGSPFQSLSMREGMLWVEDRWSPSPRVSFTFGQRIDRTSVSDTNEFAPRAGFALRPFAGDRTVIRGGAGIFYDVMNLEAGTFAESRRRVVQFFDDGTPISEVRTLSNLVSRPNLRTSSALGWNIEVDHRLTKNLLIRILGEQRCGRDLLLVKPDQPGSQVTELVISGDGQSIFRELEATASYRAANRGNFNASYIRSSSMSDTNTFASVFGNFEKLVISTNRYALSRSDAPHRFVAWGDLHIPSGFMVTPSLDIHSGYPYAFVDADANVSPIPDFGRFPRFMSFDLGLHRDLGMMTFDHGAKLRLGFAVYNLSNHFNPREAQMDETPDQKLPVLKGFLNGSGRSYRATAVLTF